MNLRSKKEKLNAKRNSWEDSRKSI